MHKKLVVMLLVGFSMQIVASEVALQGESVKRSELIKAEIDRAFWMSIQDNVTLEESGLQRFAPVIIADPSLIDKGHLGAAASENKIDVMQFLLDCGVNINGQESFGGTALHCAASEGKTEIVQFLLHRHANCEARDSSGCTPLLTAVDALEFECLQILLKNGANIYARDACGDTALHRAFTYVVPYSKCYQDAYRKTVDTLLDAGLSINIQNSRGSTVLHVMMHNKFFRVLPIEFAVKKGADIHRKDYVGRTPLFYAFLNASLHDTSSVDFLIQQGANPKAVDCWGGTILHMLADQGNYELLAKAIAVGADTMNALNCKGQTPLDRALIKIDLYRNVYKSSDDAIVKQKCMINCLQSLGAKTSSELHSEK